MMRPQSCATLSKRPGKKHLGELLTAKLKRHRPMPSIDYEAARKLLEQEFDRLESEVLEGKEPLHHVLPF